MNEDEVAARLVVLEVFTMMSLGMYMANASNDPDYSKAVALLDHLVAASDHQSQILPESARPAARMYARQLRDILAENIRAMRGEAGSSH